MVPLLSRIGGTHPKSRCKRPNHLYHLRTVVTLVLPHSANQSLRSVFTLCQMIGLIALPMPASASGSTGSRPCGGGVLVALPEDTGDAGDPLRQRLWRTTTVDRH